MNASDRSIQPSSAATGRRLGRWRRGAGLLVMALVGALLAGCGPQSTAPSAGNGGGPERFVFVRARLGLVRVDTSTGQVWTVPVNGDGGWEPRGAAPDLGDEPARNGRFQVMNVPPPRSNRLGAGADSPPLMRVDRATGRTWLLESEAAMSWMAVGESGQAPVAEPVAPTPQPTPTPRPAQPQAGTTGGDVPEAAYPILTGDQLGTTPDEKKKTLETLRTARTKTELPVKMRVWAVRQLGEVDPELAVPELLDSLSDGDPVIVAEAVRQLGRIGRGSTIPEILKLKDHPDAGVREAVSEVVVEVQ